MLGCGAKSAMSKASKLSDAEDPEKEYFRQLSSTLSNTSLPDIIRMPEQYMEAGSDSLEGGLTTPGQYPKAALLEGEVGKEISVEYGTGILPSENIGFSYSIEKSVSLLISKLIPPYVMISIIIYLSFSIFHTS